MRLNALQIHGDLNTFERTILKQKPGLNDLLCKGTWNVWPMY
jgi:hypothetical protein